MLCKNKIADSILTAFYKSLNKKYVSQWSDAWMTYFRRPVFIKNYDCWSFLYRLDVNTPAEKTLSFFPDVIFVYLKQMKVHITNGRCIFTVVL